MAALSVRATGPEGSIPTQVVVSQVASSIVLSRDPRAPGFLARAGLEAQKSPVKGAPGLEGVPGSLLACPTAAIRPSFLSQDQSKHSFGQRVSVNISQVCGRSGGSKSVGSVNKSGDSSFGGK